MNTNPESTLIQKLSEVRTALQSEREALLSRVAAIDEALGAGPSAKPQKPAKAANNIRTPKTGGIREAIANLLAAVPGLTIKQLQNNLGEHPPKTVENTVRAMASAGQLSKDESTPRKFTLPITPTTNGKPSKANGVNGSAHA